LVIRLYPNREQERIMMEHLSICCDLYNRLLEYCKGCYENGETPDGLSNAQILSHAGAHIEALHQQETDNELSIYSLQALARENAVLFQEILENQKLIGQIFIEQQTPKAPAPYDFVKGKLEGYQ